MDENDPLHTRRDLLPFIADELGAAGFDDAREIGRGGFGVVYRCTQTGLDRAVAVKILTSDLDEENRARFFREQRAMGRLTGHPNIVGVLQVGTTATGRPYLVMPYHLQGSVDARIRRHGPLTVEETLRLGVKIAGALETAHRLGILHRDVKPANILLTDYGEPALTDFGIAHIADGFKTATGTVTGSPAYTAPEVLGGESPSPASDVYGLGATLFSALTGHAAFERRSGEQVVAQFLRITAQPVPDLRENGFPDDVCQVVEKAMSRDSGDRMSAMALGEDLRQLQSRHGLPVDEMALRAEPASAQPVIPTVFAESSVGSVASQGNRETGTPETGTPSVSDRTGGLPLELTSFVDRRTELATAKNLLSTARLVTLTGIGGVGKTRLAIRVAAKSQRSFSGGVRLVELGELREATLLGGVVASALGIQDRSARPVREVLAEFLARRELLLVLDNCEQIVAAVAQLTEFLLHLCPDLTILATSREAIGIGGEVVLLVPPLPVPDPYYLPRGGPGNDAVKLFVDRGAAAVPGFELAEDNKVAIASICRQLDGHPLSIELAAARLRAMSPDQILARLTERYALLTRGSRDAPSRQQTLRMCIDWSYDLCTPAEQAVWAQLSVFSGGFELAAAEQVCGGDRTSTEILDAVTSLVDKSILIREESGATVRFRMLETLRDYGREKAQEAGEHEYTELHRRHLHWCEGVALAADAEWISPRQVELITTITREQSNLREALEFCVSENPEIGTRITAALFPVWLSQGAITEGRQWLSRFHGLRTGPPTVDQAKAIQAGSLMAAVQGDLAVSAVLVEEGRVLADQTTDPLLHAYIDQAVGYFAMFSGNLQDACSHLEKAVQVYSERKVLLFEVMALLILGLTFEQLNETDRAIEYYERALAITEEHGETNYRSYVLWAFAIATWRHGDHERATRLLKQALRLGRKINDRLAAGMCLQALSWVAVDDKDVRRAAVLMGAAEEASRSVGGTSVVVPGIIVFQDECERETRRLLGERAFAAAHREGAALGFRAAVDYALGEQQTHARTLSAGPSTHPTKRELEVADLIAEGLTNREIAARLVISPRTAQGHVEHLLVKLGFTSRAQVAAWVVEQSRIGQA